MAEIRRFARRVAERFQPEKIILFGSHAYGTPHADSDVDILVIWMRRAAREWARRAEDDFRVRPVKSIYKVGDGREIMFGAPS
jgi:predicted nucleotidyltransferase